MKAVLSFSLLFATLATFSSAGDLVGSFVPPYPEGFNESGGSCIASGRDLKTICDFSVGVLEKDNLLTLYFGKSATRTDPKQPRWLVTDQMRYPTAPDGFHIVYSMCERNGVRDDTVIAVVKSTDTEVYNEILLAYTANLDTGRFEEISTAGLKCSNESYGLNAPLIENPKKFGCSPDVVGPEDTITITKLSPQLRELAVRRPGNDVSLFLVVQSPPNEMKPLMTSDQLSVRKELKIHVKHLSGFPWKTNALPEPVFTIDGEYEFHLSSVLESDGGGYVCKVSYKSTR